VMTHAGASYDAPTAGAIRIAAAGEGGPRARRRAPPPGGGTGRWSAPAPPPPLFAESPRRGHRAARRVPTS
jgi:hypothetical protein